LAQGAGLWYAMADPLDDRKAIAAWAAMYGLEKDDPRVLDVGHNLVYVCAQLADVDDDAVLRVLSRANPRYGWAEALGPNGPSDLEAWKQLITFAVSCDGSPEHIQKIQTLEVPVQTKLMEYIQTYAEQYQHLIENKPEPPSPSTPR